MGSKLIKKYSKILMIFMFVLPHNPKVRGRRAEARPVDEKARRRGGSGRIKSSKALRRFYRAPQQGNEKSPPRNQGGWTKSLLTFSPFSIILSQK